MARAILYVLDHPEEAAAVGERAAHLAATEYSEDAYMAKTKRAIDLLFEGRAGAAAREPAR
jgi:hypothetical protein